MSELDRFSDFVGTLAVAALTWVSSVVGPGLSIDSIDTGVGLGPPEPQQALMLGWAQPVDEPPIEQVAEETGEDVETLDEAGPPVEEVTPDEDVETLDQGSPPVAQDEDVELLDQGPPPATAVAPVTEAPAPVSETTVPLTSYVATEPVSAGLVLPVGFGTDSVHVSTGSAEFPIGLAECHVGVVTGRAYAGIDCGAENMVVGHAPSFEEFPFVVEEGFPFNQVSEFANRSEDVGADDPAIFVSAAQGDPLGEAVSPDIETSVVSSVEFTQEARKRKPRIETDVEVSDLREDSNEQKDRKENTGSANDRDDRTKAETTAKKKHKDRDSQSSDKKKEKSSKSKKQAGKRDRKNREFKNQEAKDR